MSIQVLRGILKDSDLKSDPVHPNGAGYALMALMARRVAEALRRWKRGQGFPRSGQNQSWVSLVQHAQLGERGSWARSLSVGMRARRSRI